MNELVLQVRPLVSLLSLVSCKQREKVNYFASSVQKNTVQQSYLIIEANNYEV